MSILNIEERTSSNNDKYREYREENGIFTDPEKSRFLTDEYIQYLVNEYQFQEWNLTFIKTISEYFDLEGKTVLEIGGSNIPRDIIINKFKVKKWVCVDIPYWDEASNPRQHNEIKQFDFLTKLDDVWEENDYFLFRGYTDNITLEFHNKFDICFSLACLEHVQNLLYALNVIYDCLKSNGFFYTHWGPIWGSAYGSHFFVDTPGKWLTCLEPDFLPPFLHLLKSRKDIYNILFEKYGDHPKLEQWSSQIKGDSTFVNRYFYEDYEYFLEKCKFESKIIVPFYQDIDVETKEKLCDIYGGGYKEFEAGAALIMAVKKPQKVKQEMKKPHSRIPAPIPKDEQKLSAFLETIPTKLLLRKLIKRFIPKRMWVALRRMKR